ncbi:MAG: hypothetical protein R2736_02595 [Solirubrobacterales bacterium]
MTMRISMVAAAQRQRGAARLRAETISEELDLLDLGIAGGSAG